MSNSKMKKLALGLSAAIAITWSATADAQVIQLHLAADGIEGVVLHPRRAAMDKSGRLVAEAARIEIVFEAANGGTGGHEKYSEQIDGKERSHQRSLVGRGLVCSRAFMSILAAVSR